MKIEIDQSNKIEQTNKDSVVSFSNNIFGCVLIRAKDKREIEKVFQRTGKPKIFVYKLFAILIFILIKEHLRKIDEIVIDKEYPGKDNLIKSFLMREIKKVRPDFLPQAIIFKQIGKKSRAHFVAYGVIANKKQPDKVVGVKTILRFLIK